MLEFSSRTVSKDEAPAIARLLKLMVEDMASVGGHPVAQDPSVWRQIQTDIANATDCKDHLLLGAFISVDPRTLIGFAAAHVVGLEPIFDPKRILHISAIYVITPHRRKGVARMLLQRLIDWALAQGCAEVELNSLTHNPARQLYARMGFVDNEVRMTRRL